MVDFDSRADVLRERLFRGLLYGSPFVAALMMLATYRFVIEMSLDSTLIKYSARVFALLGAFGSGAGAFSLRNRMALRIAHAIAAALVSIAVYAVIFAALLALMPQ